MKTIDVSKSVMQRVAMFERRRVAIWITLFLAGIGALVGLIGVSLWSAVQVVSERQSLELLTLFQEDPEIIHEFWRDTLATFWEELPVHLLLGVAVLCVVIILIVLVTRKQ